MRGDARGRQDPRVLSTSHGRAAPDPPLPRYSFNSSSWRSSSRASAGRHMLPAPSVAAHRVRDAPRSPPRAARTRPRLQPRAAVTRPRWAGPYACAPPPRATGLGRAVPARGGGAGRLRISCPRSSGTQLHSALLNGPEA